MIAIPDELVIEGIARAMAAWLREALRAIVDFIAREWPQKARAA